MWKQVRNNWKLVLIVAVAAFLLGLAISGNGDAGTTDAHSKPGHDHAHDTGATIWTCSMHPQIRMNEPGQCPICGMDLIPAADKETETGPRELKLSDTARKLAEIETAPIVRKPAIHEVRMVGKVAYDETREKTISAWIGGRIDNMFVDYTGAFVRKGDPLVSLYSPDLYAAQQELLQALKSDRERGTAVTRKRLVAARKKLQLLGLSRDQISRVETTGQLSTHVTIRSPLSGIVIHRGVVEGSYVKTGQPMYRVADLSQVWLELDAYESDIQWVREGQDVRFHVEAYPGRTFDGKVVFVDPILNPKTRTIRVRANVPNEAGLLKPDMFAHAVVEARLDERGEVTADGAGPADPLIVPASAPLITGTRAVVYVAVSDQPGVFEGREIVLGPRADGGYVVLEGLKEGDRVVVKGNFKIDSELQIQAKPSMMYAEGGAPMSGHNHGNMKMGAGKTSEKAPDMDAGQAKKDHAAGETDVDGTKPVIRSGPAREALDAVLTAYFEAADALSLDKADVAAQAGRKIAATLDGLSMNGMDPTLHKAWMPHHGKLQAAARLLAQSGTLDDARKAFKNLSDELVRLLGAVDYRGSHAVYRYHCPMAFDSKGADWLQETEGTANPYFGSKMFKCGSLEERIAEAAGGGK